MAPPVDLLRTMRFGMALGALIGGLFSAVATPICKPVVARFLGSTSYEGYERLMACLDVVSGGLLGGVVGATCGAIGSLRSRHALGAIRGACFGTWVGFLLALLGEPIFAKEWFVWGAGGALLGLVVGGIGGGGGGAGRRGRQI